MTKYNKEDFKNILPKRPENSHKGTFGHVLNIAGSEFYTGAAYFSSVAPLKVGCGLVTLASAETVLRTVSALCPDIILMPLNKIKKEITDNFQAISIGCGLGTGANSVKFFKKIIKMLIYLPLPVVIDADGLNILSGHCEAKGVGCTFSICTKQSRLHLSQLPQNTILTPHPKELSRLMGVNVENILLQPEFWVKECSEKYRCTTVLKLHKTLVADNEGHFYENNTGNSALSHGGSGDVLCGMISGFLAQGKNCFDSACLAVYLHGLAGELASKDLTEYSVLASDLLNYIPKAIKTII